VIDTPLLKYVAEFVKLANFNSGVSITQSDEQESRAIAEKPRDAVLNFDVVYTL